MKKKKVVSEKKEKSLQLFDFVAAVSYTKEQLIVDEESEKKYNPFMVNKALSFGQDTIFFANAMNEQSHLPKKLQFDFFINSLRPMKRYNAWVKGEKDEVIELIQQYFGYNVNKAREALRILTPDQLNDIKMKMSTGGTSNGKQSTGHTT